MHIERVSISNFRLLSNVELCFEPRTTVIVGRNNSGKTSLSELFRRLLSERSPTFRLEDFSLGSHHRFWDAYKAHLQGVDSDAVRAILPVISVTMTVAYESSATSLGPLSDFVLDFDPGCTTAKVVLEYRLKDGRLGSFFDALNIDLTSTEDKQKASLLRGLREKITAEYALFVTAVDPNDASNKCSIDVSVLRSLILGGFINAQRGLDDVTQRETNLIGKVLEGLLAAAMTESANQQEQDTAQQLEAAVKAMQDGLDEGFNQRLQQLLPAFRLFGYPGLNDPQLVTETTLDVERLLTNHTKVHYAGRHGVNLPEAYNGLGVRNLVLILLKLYEYFKAYLSQPTAPGMHLVFIEEPEVHLHPQMQEVFIGQLAAIAETFSRDLSAGAPWPVQFIVSTHSSHVASKASFDNIRYFASRDTADGTRTTTVKDLRQGLGGAAPEDREFLHKYMTLTRCDLLFADKAVLIEGAAERLMLPRMIRLLDKAVPKQKPLASEYLSIVEVGGAHAHLFFNLIDFIELKTLIITDIDATREGATASKYVKCKVSAGTRTSNECIKAWFGDHQLSPQELLAKPAEAKILGHRRLAYQVPESDELPCGRSFEDAFIVANHDIFQISGSKAEMEEAAWRAAETLVTSKADFALQYALSVTDWRVPKYISEGLLWLSEPPAPKNASEASRSDPAQEGESHAA